LTFASRISIIQENKKFIEFEKNKWIKKTDIKKINHIEKNYLKVFNLFLNTKYLWGGKTYKGIDCSAILQLLYYYNNRFYPRDTKDQIKYSKKNTKKRIFKKGDIIFWKGHVAICINSQKLIHAYGPQKKVLIMPIKETINIIEKTAQLIIKKVSSIKY
jgi:cell wall-associated NlpC family hydrolase